MYRIYDLECTNLACDQMGIELLDQMLTLTDGVLEQVPCKGCSKPLGTVIPSPKGYVRGSRTRCIQH